MRFAELQLGGGGSQVHRAQGLHFCYSIPTPGRRRYGKTNGLKKKVDGQTDEAALFIESQTRQSITPYFSSAYLSHNRCALSVFLR